MISHRSLKVAVENAKDRDFSGGENMKAAIVYQARIVAGLFEQEGVTFPEFLLWARLEQAHRMLSALRFSGRTVASIAYTAGFGDLSSFNRAFRKHYGMTPSDVRAAARRRRREPDS
jgi:AraC-like DNA-binding protein